MKKIKVSFIGVLEGYGSIDEIWVYKILNKYYDVLILDNPEEADYLICGLFTTPYSFCEYQKQIRIFFTGENYIPDLNLVDYAISPYPVYLFDRCYRMPVFIDQFGHCQQLKYKDRNYDLDFLKNKQYFANFISSHESEFSLRGDFFKELNKYKRIESPGTYLNNMNGFTVDWTDNGKVDFQRKCKFTLCFESTIHNGFITEKIVDAFFSDTIPIYCGSPDVIEIFNENAFIYCRGRDDFDRVIKKVIELDNNDDKYIEMMRQPIFNNSDCVDEILDGFESYLKKIFDQPLNGAYRRSQVYSPKRHEDYLLALKRQYEDCVIELKREKEKFRTCKQLVKELFRRLKRRVVK